MINGFTPHIIYLIIFGGFGPRNVSVLDSATCLSRGHNGATILSDYFLNKSIVELLDTVICLPDGSLDSPLLDGESSLLSRDPLCTLFHWISQ